MHSETEHRSNGKILYNLCMSVFEITDVKHGSILKLWSVRTIKYCDCNVFVYLKIQICRQFNQYYTYKQVCKQNIQIKLTVCEIKAVTSEVCRR